MSLSCEDRSEIFYREVPFGDVACRQSYVIHGIDQDIQVVLDLVEVPLVLIGDLRRNISLADAIDIGGSHVDGGRESFDEPVDAGDHLSPRSPVSGRVSADVEPSLLNGRYQAVGLPYEFLQGLEHRVQALAQEVLFRPFRDVDRQVSFGDFACHPGDFVHGIDQDVEVVLGLVEIPLVLIGDSRGDIPLADAIDIGGGHADGGREGFDEPVYAAQKVPPRAFIGGGVAPGAESPLLDGHDQTVGVSDQ